MLFVHSCFAWILSVGHTDQDRANSSGVKPLEKLKNPSSRRCILYEGVSIDCRENFDTVRSKMCHDFSVSSLSLSE